MSTPNDSAESSRFALVEIEIHPKVLELVDALPKFLPPEMAPIYEGAIAANIHNHLQIARKIVENYKTTNDWKMMQEMGGDKWNPEQIEFITAKNASQDIYNSSLEQIGNAIGRGLNKLLDQNKLLDMEVISIAISKAGAFYRNHLDALTLPVLEIEDAYIAMQVLGALSCFHGSLFDGFQLTRSACFLFPYQGLQIYQAFPEVPDLIYARH